MSVVHPSRPPVVTTYDAVARQSAAVVIRTYSTSFALASRLLAAPVRAHVSNVYALVRIADEIVDCPDLGLSRADRADLLARLQEDTARALRTGRSSNLVVHAFAGTARSCGIGTDLVDPFFVSMATDLHRKIHDPASQQSYIYGSAEVVGLMCLRVFLAAEHGGAGFAELAPGARRLGAAFQKVNFLRDLGEDSTVLERSYFPGLVLDAFTERERDLLLDDIDADLAAADRVIPLLPRSSRLAVAAAHALFAELSRRLRATPAHRIRSERVRVPGAVKAGLILRLALGGGSR